MNKIWFKKKKSKKFQQWNFKTIAVLMFLNPCEQFYYSFEICFKITNCSLKLKLILKVKLKQFHTVLISFKLASFCLLWSAYAWEVLM